MVTFALGLVTLTDSCLARAMISIRFLEETLWAILRVVSLPVLLVVLYHVFVLSRPSHVVSGGKETYSAA